MCSTSRTSKQAAAYEMSGAEQVLTSWRCNRARSRRAWRRRGARSNTWWWTSYCYDPLGPTLGRGEGTAQSQSVAKEKAVSGVITQGHKPLLIWAHAQIYLPEPAPLQESEGAAQQLQNDVASVEDLQEGNKCVAEDGIEKELMHMDVQHTPAMEVVQEKKSCKNKKRQPSIWKNSWERWRKMWFSPIFYYTGICQFGILTAFLFFIQLQPCIHVHIFPTSLGKLENTNVLFLTLIKESNSQH